MVNSTTNLGLPYWSSLDPASADIWNDNLVLMQVGLDKQALRDYIFPISDEVTPLSTGTSEFTFVIPYNFTLKYVYASVNVASTSGIPTFDLKVSGSSILSTKITIDVNELTSSTAAIPPVISTPNITAFAPISADINIAGTNTAGAKIYLVGILT